MVHDKTMDELDKKDFDYTSKMIAREMKFSRVKEYSRWPGGGGVKYCSNCIHWVKKKKTHGNSYCNLKESDYCVSHDRLYYTRRHHSDPENDFIREEEMEIE